MCICICVASHSICLFSICVSFVALFRQCKASVCVCVSYANWNFRTSGIDYGQHALDTASTRERGEQQQQTKKRKKRKKKEPTTTNDPEIYVTVKNHHTIQMSHIAKTSNCNCTRFAFLERNSLYTKNIVRFVRFNQANEQIRSQIILNLLHCWIEAASAHTFTANAA